MGTKVKKTLLRIGKDTPALSVPRGWARFHGLEFGDEVTMFGNTVLVVAPKEFEERAKRVLQILDKYMFQAVEEKSKGDK